MSNKSSKEVEYINLLQLKLSKNYLVHLELRFQIKMYISFNLIKFTVCALYN
jgi:hypothetical protein